MIYMRSTSGNDGSYNLTVSFVLGSDPDINTSMSTTGCRPPWLNCLRKSSWRG